MSMHYMNVIRQWVNHLSILGDKILSSEQQSRILFNVDHHNSSTTLVSPIYPPHFSSSKKRNREETEPPYNTYSSVIALRSLIIEKEENPRHYSAQARHGKSPTKNHHECCSERAARVEKDTTKRYAANVFMKKTQKISKKETISSILKQIIDDSQKTT